MQTTLSEDDLFLLACFILLALTVVLAAYRSKRPRRTILIHAAACAGYALPLLYGLHYNSSGGTALAWFIYLLFALALHWLVCIVLLMSTSRKR